MFIVLSFTLGLVGCSHTLQAVETQESLLNEGTSVVTEGGPNRLKEKSLKQKEPITKNHEPMPEETVEQDESETKEALAEEGHQKNTSESNEENTQSQETTTGKNHVGKLTKKSAGETEQTKLVPETSQAQTKEKEQQKVNDKSNVAMIDMLLPNSHSEPRDELVSHVVIHFSSYAAIKPEHPYKVDDIYQTFKDYEVSAHYLVDREGKIYRMVPESRVAYHAGKGHLEQFLKYKNCLNHYSIGIEIMAIGAEKEMLPMMSADTYRKVKDEHIGYTNAQYESVRKLVDDIVSRYPHVKKDRQHIVGHDEYAKGRKTDPGSLFDWSKIGF